MAKFVTLDQLKLFKNLQDTSNETKYMEVVKYVDSSSGQIKVDSLKSSVDVIPVHVVNSKFYADNNGVKADSEISGESGKIYIDLESGSSCIYTYNSNSDSFIPFMASVATDDDIASMFED